MNTGIGTVSFGSIYGPNAGGQSIQQSASASVIGGSLDRLPLAPVALLALGLLAWWVLEKWD